MELSYAVDLLVAGFPGRSTAHGPLGWSGITLLRGGGRTVLVDTGGFGLRWPLRAGLAERGVAPDDVTDVLLTHVHYDHAVNALLFGRARVWISAADLDWACARSPGFDAVPELHAAALAADPRTHRIEARGEVLPGVEAIPAPGHTPGSLAYRVAGAEAPVLFAGDAVKNRAELVSGEVDMTEDRAASEASVRRLRDLWLAVPGTVLVPGHDMPLRPGPDGRPEYAGVRRAGVEAWFGDDLGGMTRFDLTAGGAT
jgi:glyoxylase-like metal-dependent hydrolase (beta-lactamase superfamily II)